VNPDPLHAWFPGANQFEVVWVHEVGRIVLGAVESDAQSDVIVPIDAGSAEVPMLAAPIRLDTWNVGKQSIAVVLQRRLSGTILQLDEDDMVDARWLRRAG